MKTIVELFGIGVASLLITGVVWLMEWKRKSAWHRRKTRHRRKYFAIFLDSMGPTVFLGSFLLILLLVICFGAIDFSGQ